jgi:site-specific recombinase XerC
MTAVPRAIAVDQVRQLLNSINRTTSLGRREYAIVLVLARLGLRASEAAFLELDDINWKAGN